MKKLVCNLKSSFTEEMMNKYIQELNSYDSNHVEPIILAPYPFINLIKKPLRRGSQDVSIFNDNLAVGEVTAKMLASFNTDYVLVGHSDRKIRYKESEIDFIKKINNALESNIKAIYCIGETREEKLRRKTYIVLEKQIARVFNHLEGNINNIILAYEPTWALSNNKNDFDNINVTEISETIIFIKNIVKSYYNVDIEVIYGGSVNANNIDLYRNLKSDGLLIGQSSLIPEDVKRIASKL